MMYICQTILNKEQIKEIHFSRKTDGGTMSRYLYVYILSSN